MYFAQNVKHLIALKRWSKADLARETKISPPAIGRYLNGERQPKIEQVIDIARVLDVNIDDLLLKDLTSEKARPFGAEGEDSAETDDTLKRMNQLLEQRVAVLEMNLKEQDPELAKRLGIE